jgi:FtsP/CotA-like multicopper oxidase with cupredoxin domain
MSDTSLTDSVTAVLEQQTSRRRFLREAGVTALVAGVAGACKATPAQRAAPKLATPSAPAITQAGGVASAASIRVAADAMDAMHEKRMRAFPAKTAGKGCQVLDPRIEHGVKVFELTARKTQWETEPGMMVEAWSYNGQVPGPRLHVREGDRVRVILHNELPESTSIHFHGLEIPNDQDGVPFITQPPVKPGDSFTYEFTARNAGSHMYHSHHDSTKQVGLGLLGAFIVAPKQPMPIERVDEDFVLILNDGMGGYTLNGKSFPATEPLVARLGDRIRIRFMNEGMMIHPMHLHGMHMTIITKDGWPLPAPYRCDTLNVAPGDRWDAIVECTNPGTWAFHCHILPHAESDRGMFGMVTALVVQK